MGDGERCIWSTSQTKIKPNRGGVENCTWTSSRLSRMDAGSGLDPMWSNMFPKASNSEFSSARSESNNRGGVAVLAVLDVMVLFLGLLGRTGGPPDGEVGDPRLPFIMPKDNVLVGLARNPCLPEGGGGTGMSLKGLDPEFGTFLSDFVSREEGFVEEVLRRAEEAALPLGAVE